MTKTAATTAAVFATTAALTAGLAATAPEALAAHNRTARADVELVAAASSSDIGKIPDIVGIYGVGPIFWAAQLLGITPENVITAAGGLTGNTELAATVNSLLKLLDEVSPFKAGISGPLPSDVYDSVNGLKYTTTGLAGMLGVGGWFVDLIVKTAPILNQRRSIVVSESLGGLSTSLAYRDMIDAVQSDDASWGVGVTGQWLIFVNNVSRPGGGLLALATPFTNLFGVNLTTPDAGSYTNSDLTKVLNTSILDITWAYNPLSDAPTTLNPLAWANAAAAGMFLTYLLPDEGHNIADVISRLGDGIGDGVKVMIDPSGGQGLAMVPIIGPLLKDVDFLDFPGNATYVTYDSGNLPLLEPLRMVPHLVNLLPGVHVPTPLTDSVEDALRKLVNMGYQDVDPETLERTFAEAGDQAYLWHSPLTPTQQLAAVQTVFNALVDGIQDNALNPVAWTPQLPGADFKPVVQNPVSMALAKAVNDAVDAIQKNATDPVFDAVEKGLAPVTTALDHVNAQIESTIDSALKVNGTTADRQAVTAVPSNDNRRTTVSLSAAAPDAQDAPVRKAERPKGVKKLRESFKASPGRHAADAADPAKKTAREIIDKVTDTNRHVAKQAEKAGGGAKRAAKDKAA